VKLEVKSGIFFLKIAAEHFTALDEPNLIKLCSGFRLWPLFASAPGVNINNILHVCFSYKSKLSSFSLITFGFVIFGAKIVYKNVDEIDPCCLKK